MNDLNNLNQNPNTPPGTPPGDEGADPNAPPAELTYAEMLSGIQKELGGAPSTREGAPQMTEVEKQIMDDNFEIKARQALEDMGKEARMEIPDATDTQAFEMGKAMMNGDMTAMIRAVRQAIKTESEIDESKEEQKSLHVEGGASGKPESRNEPEGTMGVLERISRQYASRNA